MEINTEIITRGKVRIQRTDFESFKVIHDYNQEAFVDKMKMRRVRELKRVIKKYNFLVLVVISILYGCNYFKIPYAAIMILTLVGVLWVTGKKDRYSIYGVVSFIFVILDIKFIPLFLVNVILIGWMGFLEYPLRSKIGYPEFDKIEILHEDMEAYERRSEQESFSEFYNNEYQGNL